MNDLSNQPKQASAEILGRCYPETAAQGHRTFQTEEGVTVSGGALTLAERTRREMAQGQQANSLDAIRAGIKGAPLIATDRIAPHDPEEIARQLGLIQPAEASGAMREKRDAIPYDLVPFQEMTEAYARVAEFGAKKYAAWNWSLGLKRVQILGSLLRHAFAYLRGEDRDRESGLLHTDHILWNAAALSHNVHWNLEDGRRAEPPRDYKA